MILIIVSIGTGVALYALQKHTSDNPVSHSDEHAKHTSDKQTEQLSQQQADQKKDYIDKAVEAEGEHQNNSQNTSQQPTQGATPAISLSAQQSGESIIIYTQLDPVPSGTCKLTITNGSKTATRTADIIYQSQQSICAGFSIPKTELGTGTWTVSLAVQSPRGNAQKTIQKEVQ